MYEVCRDELYWTYKGAPSYLNNKEIHVSDVSDMDEAFVALGFPYDSQKYKPLAEHIVHELYGNVGGMRLQGAAAAELCYVAAGRFEARIEGLLGPWDIAAGSIILMNAGGKSDRLQRRGETFIPVVKCWLLMESCMMSFSRSWEKK